MFTKTTTRAGILALILASMPVSASAASPDIHALHLNATAIPDPIEIGLLWSQEQSSATTVFIATGHHFADSLASSLARTGPLLFTEEAASALHPAVKAEISRLGATKAVILGGTAAVKPAIASELTAMGLTVSRLSGASQVETAIAIAEHTGLNADNTILLVRGTGAGSASYADALAAGAYSAKRGYPVLINQPGPGQAVHPAVMSYIADKGVAKVILIGGTAALPANVAQAIQDQGVTVERIAGPSRVETANAIAEQWPGDTGKRVVINGYAPQATGWQNGFAASNVAVAHNAPIVLTNGSTIATGTLDQLTPQSGSGPVGWTGTYVDTNVQTQVATKAGATVVTKELGNQGISPSGMTSLIADSANDKVTVTATGLDATKTYVLRLVEGKQVGGAYTPVVTGGNYVVSSATGLGWTSLNGSTMASTYVTSAAAPVGGSVTGVVSVAASGHAAIAYPQIMDGTTVVATGGPIVVTPGEGAQGAAFGGGSAAPNGIVQSVNVQAKTVVVGNKTYYFGTPGSTFFKGTNTAGNQISAADFAALIRVGDELGSDAYYRKEQSIPTSFTIDPVQHPVLQWSSPTQTSTTLSTIENWPTGVDPDIWEHAKVKVLLASQGRNVTINGFSVTNGTLYNGPTAMNTTTTYATVTRVPGQTKSKVELTGLQPNTQYAVNVAWEIDGRLGLDATLGDNKTFTLMLPNTVTIESLLRAGALPADVDHNVDGSGDTEALLLTLDQAIPTGPADHPATPGATDGENAGVIPAAKATAITVKAEGSGNIPVSASSAKYVTTNAYTNPTTSNGVGSTSQYLWVDLASPIPDTNHATTYKVTIPAGTFITADGAPNAELTTTFTY